MKTYTTQKGDKGLAIGVTELDQGSKKALEAIRDADKAFHNAVCAMCGVKPDVASVYRKGMVVFVTKAKERNTSTPATGVKDAAKSVFA